MGYLTHKRNGRQQARVDQRQTQRNSAEGQTEHLRQNLTGKTAINAVSGRPSRAEITLMSTSGPKTTVRREACSNLVGVPIIFSEEYREPRS